MTARRRIARVVLLGVLVAGCATAVPSGLVDARRAYRQERAGQAAELAPAYLYQAEQALAEANRAFADEGDTETTRRLAYVAERKVRLVSAQASILSAQHRKQDADRWRERATATQLAQARGALNEAETRHATEVIRLATQQEELSRSRSELEVERQSRIDAERKASEALTRLQHLGKLQAQERGIVLTLTGSVLFAFDEWHLLPSAHATLDDVAAALQDREETLLVEGHTDAVGSEGYNQDLSFSRARAVRDYLVGRGIADERVRAIGRGESRPVARNGTPEGRANNRRVEIVLQRPPAR